MLRSAISSPDAATIGPYSHAVEAGALVYLSGQTPIDPATGALAGGTAAEQARQCLHNLFRVLEAAGLSEEDVVKVNVYLTDMADFAAMNDAYAEHFTAPYPARTTVGVASLPMGARIEIELLARRSGLKGAMPASHGP